MCKYMRRYFFFERNLINLLNKSIGNGMHSKWEYSSISSSSLSLYVGLSYMKFNWFSFKTTHFNTHTDKHRNKLMWPNCAVIFWPLATTKPADEWFACLLRVDILFMSSLRLGYSSRSLSLSFYLLRYTFGARTYLKFGTKQLINNAMSFVS